MTGWRMRRLLCRLQRPDERFDRVAFLVAIEKNLRMDDAVRTDDKRAGIRNAVPAFGCILVADAVGVNGLAAGIGQEWERERALVGEALEDGR